MPDQPTVYAFKVPSWKPRNNTQNTDSDGQLKVNDSEQIIEPSKALSFASCN